MSAFISCARILFDLVNTDISSAAVNGTQDVHFFRKGSTCAVLASTPKCVFIKGSVSVPIQDENTWAMFHFWTSDHLPGILYPSRRHSRLNSIRIHSLIYCAATGGRIRVVPSLLQVLWMTLHIMFLNDDEL